MKRICKFFVLLFLSIFFIPSVNAAPIIPSISVPDGRTYIYYQGPQSAVEPAAFGSGFYKGTFRFLRKKVLVDVPKVFIYYKNGKLRKTVEIESESGFAQIVLPKAAYYYDNEANKVLLDIKITLTYLKLVPFDGDNCDDDDIGYAVFSYGDSKVYTSSRIMNVKSENYTYNNVKYKLTGKEVGGRKPCDANSKVGYRVELVGKVPSNPAFLWRITDLDQPDKKPSPESFNYKNHHYVESMVFGSGFDAKYYLSAGSPKSNVVAIKSSDKATYINKFIASTKSDSEGKVDPNNFLTSVWKFQTSSSANIKWIGTRGVETSLVGNDTKYTPPVCVKPYGINGSVVDDATFESQCTCKVINGKYYGFDGDDVNATNFKSQCTCRSIGNGQYLDASGNVTGFDGWKNSCTCNKRGDYYYGTNGQIVSYWDHLSQCVKPEYTGDSCVSSNNSVVDDSCNGASVVDKPKKGNTKFDSLNLNSDSLEHTSCKSGVYGYTQTLYIKEPTKHMNITYNGSLITNGCAPVSVSIPLTITENIYLNISKLNGKKIKNGDPNKEYVYAGGGFGWNGSTVKNELARIWAVSKKNPKKDGDIFEKAFKISFNYKLGTSSPNVGYYKLSEVPLYKNASCTELISYDELENTVVANNKIEINDLSLDQKFYASTDVNDVEVTEKSMLGVLNKEPNPEIGGFSNKTNSVSLKNAYIDRRTAKVSYSDTISIDETSTNSENSNLVNAGQLYYVPLKYTGDEFAIGMNNQNLSVIGQSTSFSTICKINVEHIFYEKDKKTGRLRTAFRYRPIKVDDTFNGKNKAEIAENAQNWARWYCGEDNNCKTTNRNRIESTYDVAGCNNTNEAGKCNNPLYRVSFDSEKISNIRHASNGLAYNDFSSIYVNGTSSFINEDNGFDVIANRESYCKLGGFNSNCDLRKSGDS